MICMRMVTINNKNAYISTFKNWYFIMMVSNTATKYNRGAPKLDFENAAAKLFLMGVKKRQHFKNLSRDKKRPQDIPSSPHTFYSEFTTWEEMLAIGEKASMKGKGRTELLPPYEELKALTRRYSITTQQKYKEVLKSGKLGEFAPKNPELCYKEEFEGWANFLAPTNRFVDFNTARALCRGYELKTSSDWVEFCREGCRPAFIPAMPHRDYKEFTTWKDFLIGPEKNNID